MGFEAAPGLAKAVLKMETKDDKAGYYKCRLSWVDEPMM